MYRVGGFRIILCHTPCLGFGHESTQFLAPPPFSDLTHCNVWPDCDIASRACPRPSNGLGSRVQLRTTLGRSSRCMRCLEHRCWRLLGKELQSVPSTEYAKWAGQHADPSDPSKRRNFLVYRCRRKQHGLCSCCFRSCVLLGRPPHW